MMAVDLPNRDQLHPPPLLKSQFFTEEEQNISSVKPIKKTYSSCFSSSGFGSIFSSPVESEQCSTESSESDQDDDDYIAELTRKMTHYMLQDDENNRSEEEDEGLDAEWPKLGMKDKIGNLHKNEEITDDDDECSSKQPTIPNLNFQSKKALIDEQIRIIKLNKAKQEQFMKQQKQNELNRQFYMRQQQYRKGSEMRAVFLGQSGKKGGSNGTGVFLPRGITNNNNQIDSRKKTGCSTVLIPARVVQALKLQYERMGIEARYITGATFVNQNDGMILGNLKYGQQQQQCEKKSQSQTMPAPAAMNNKEIIGLPQEWTY